MDTHPELIAASRARLEAAGDPARAVREKAYLKSELVHLGSGQPAVRAEARALDAALQKKLPGASLLAIAEALHATGVHELRALGIALLERRRKALTAADLPALIDLVRRSPGWAYVDWLAIKVVGPVLARLPAAEEAGWLRAWAVDPDLWVRRSALLAPLDRLRKGQGDFALWSRLAAPMLEEKSFWIRKALGWVLREVGRPRPDWLSGFFAAHDTRITGLTRREAAKHTPALR